MKIYVSHSRHFDFKKELYAVLENSNLDQDFIFPHKESDAPFNSKDLLKDKGCDLVLAEVSYPATGQGIELGWANIHNIPIVCIFKKNSKISGSLSVVSKDFIEYEDEGDLENKLKEYLNNL